jgi:hypothetical protein
MIHQCSDEQIFCHNLQVIPAFCKMRQNMKSKMPTHGKKGKSQNRWLNMGGRWIDLLFKNTCIFK